jgi:hypothetical protein
MKGIKRNDIDDGAIIPGQLGSELKYFSQIVNVGDIAADSDAIVHALLKPKSAITIKRLLTGVDTAISAADTDYQTLNITDGTNVIATVSTGPAATGQSFTAGTFVELTVDATYANIANTETIKAAFAKTGNGMAMSALQIQIDYTIDDPA